MRPSKQIDLYVPTQHNDGSPIALSLLREEERFLVSMFGGVTVLAGCSGLWRSPTGQTQREPIEIWRVLVWQYDYHWWAGYQQRALSLYEQEEFLIVASDCERVQHGQT